MVLGGMGSVWMRGKWSMNQNFISWILSDDYGADRGKCCRKVAFGRNVVGVILSCVNTRSLQLEFSMVLLEGLFVTA